MKQNQISGMISLRPYSYNSPTDLDDYIANNGFAAFKKGLEMDSLAIISEVTESGIRGRGGAGFPTGVKWKFAAGEVSQEKYMIANADEGEPGTFKDRYIMEQFPFRFIEGLMIGAIAINAEEAWIYIRREYSNSIKILNEAIGKLYAAGIIGKNIDNAGRRLDIYLTAGAGSYLCGDETTLLESMEGKRGNPRYKPPFPAQKGFRSKPTVVNNVETLSHIPDIILKGANWYRSYGTSNSTGTKIYCLSGRVNNPGVYELPMGTTMRSLISDYAGGVKKETKLKGALLGGAAGTFVNTSFLDTPLDYDNLKNNGATLGSGAVIVIGESDSIPFMLHNIMKFFRHESCGKCVPCRVGCHRLEEMAVLLLSNPSNKMEIIELMKKESAIMRATSLCGLGQSPVLPVTSAFRFFSNEF